MSYQDLINHVRETYNCITEDWGGPSTETERFLQRLAAAINYYFASRGC